MSVALLLRAVRERALAMCAKSAFLGPLLARITVGVLFMSTGWGKVHDLQKVTEFFAELQIPAPAFHAVFVSYLELLGGALLVLGLAARLISVPLIVAMVVAIATARSEEVSGFADLFGLVEWTYIALMAWIALAGPGPVSIDRMLFGRGTTRSLASVSPAALSERTA